jgi:hypothetical protein
VWRWKRKRANLPPDQPLDIFHEINGLSSCDIKTDTDRRRSGSKGAGPLVRREFGIRLPSPWRCGPAMTECWSPRTSNRQSQAVTEDIGIKETFRWHLGGSGQISCVRRIELLHVEVVCFDSLKISWHVTSPRSEYWKDRVETGNDVGAHPDAQASLTQPTKASPSHGPRDPCSLVEID